MWQVQRWRWMIGELKWRVWCLGVVSVVTKIGLQCRKSPRLGMGWTLEWWMQCWGTTSVMTIQVLGCRMNWGVAMLRELPFSCVVTIQVLWCVVTPVLSDYFYWEPCIHRMLSMCQLWNGGLVDTEDKALILNDLGPRQLHLYATKWNAYEAENLCTEDGNLQFLVSRLRISR